MASLPQCNTAGHAWVVFSAAPLRATAAEYRRACLGSVLHFARQPPQAHLALGNLLRLIRSMRRGAALLLGHPIFFAQMFPAGMPPLRYAGYAAYGLTCLYRHVGRVSRTSSQFPDLEQPPAPLRRRVELRPAIGADLLPDLRNRCAAIGAFIHGDALFHIRLRRREVADLHLGLHRLPRYIALAGTAHPCFHTRRAPPRAQRAK